MMCPKCGNRPLTFSQFLRSMNPMRIRCGRCDAELKAGPFAYFWTVLHVPIAIGLVALRGTIGWWLLPLAIAVVFCTAYVIPYFAFHRLYRIASLAA